MSEVPPHASANHFSLADLLREQARDLYDAERSHRAHLGALDRRGVAAELAGYLEKIADDISDNIEILTEICRLLQVSPESNITIHTTEHKP
ncbi:MAG TPA: hypothetical protein VMN36_17355 [Verrucomicrobiales bacterium]|nr:hypothetical protein [Verrucomicrobiales bacterium]